MTVSDNFDYTDNYKSVDFLDEARFLQSQELNEIQSRARRDFIELSAKTAPSFVKSGGYNTIDGSGNVTLDAADVWVNGIFLRVASGSVTIPAGLEVKVGVRLTEATVTSSTDAALLNPATGEEGYNKPGADRKQVSAAWGWEASDASDDGGSGTLYPLMYFYDRNYLTQRSDARLPKATINSTNFDGMVLFEDIVYDLDLATAASSITVHVDNDSFYQGSEQVYGFIDTQGGVGAYQLTIQRDDANIRFNGDDNELLVATRYLQFFIRRESTTVWNVTGVNYGN